VARILDLGCRIKAQTLGGQTTLHLACYSGNLEYAKLLLAARTSLSTTLRYSTTPLHDAVASKYATTELIELLIQNGAVVSAKDACGVAPLHEAATVSCDTVQLLLRHGADINAQNTNGNTPIALAVRYANSKSLTILHQAGVDLTMVNFWSYNILHQAAYLAQLATRLFTARLG